MMRKLRRASLFAATVPVQIGTLMTTGPEGWCSCKPL
jgi:hypothetical protein